MGGMDFGERHQSRHRQAKIAQGKRRASAQSVAA
jgi:hypothetical protein